MEENSENKIRLTKFYEEHDCSKIPNVDGILMRYSSHIGALKYHLERKYKATPDLLSDAMIAAADQLEKGVITAEEFQEISAMDRKIQNQQRLDCMIEQQEEEYEVALMVEGEDRQTSQSQAKQQQQDAQRGLWFSGCPTAAAQEHKDRTEFLSILQAKRLRIPSTEADFHAARFYSDRLHR
jgi:hypothetical protein